MNARIVNLTGMQGGKVITDTAATTPGTGKTWQAIQVFSDAVIDDISSNLDGDTGLTGVPLPAGMVIYGRFTSLTLTSGKVIAYLE